ncbi:hypothetical protein BMR02_03875 [Methylococcaceae bacterium HT1]|nr:hypothetical protein BMR02_03875 [Methylococcaceae bacterium HT1]
MTQDFGCTAAQGKQAHSRGYATVFLVRLCGQKTSQIWVLLNSRSLGALSSAPPPKRCKEAKFLLLRLLINKIYYKGAIF